MLKLNKEDKKKLNELFYEKEDNIFLASLVNEYLVDHESLKDGIDLSNKEESFRYALFDYLGLDLDDKYTLNKIKEYELDKIKSFNKEKILTNPYFKNVLPNEVRVDKYHLYYKKYLSYEGFLSDEIELKSYFKEINKFSYFEEEINFLSLDKDDVTWMSITPHEINSMEKDIANAKGNVLVAGLGLGYFLYMVSLKEEVKNIVVIEKDKKIIEIFNNYLLPFFKNKDKFKIIEEDIFKYSSINKFDYVYIDIYHDPVEALPLYIDLIKLDKDNKFHFWIETSIISYFRRFVLTLFLEEIEEVDTSIYYQKAKDFDTKLINSIYIYLKDIEFNSFEEIINFLKEDSLKEVIKRIKVK